MRTRLLHPVSVLASAVLVGALVTAGCAQHQQDAFLRNVGGVDGLVKSIKDAVRDVDEPKEIEMGAGVTETLLGARPLLDDPPLQKYVNEVGRWVAQQSDRPLLPWKFGVTESDHVNAFAAPGGYILVTRGMLQVTRNEAELAGVLGHEIAHVIRKHHLKAIKKGAWATLLGAGVAGAAAGTPSDQVVEALVGPTKELYARGLDKDDEFEADRVGVVLATRAGYDPYGLPAALQVLGAIKADDPYLALLFKTHPNPSTRLEKLATAMGTRFDGWQGGPDNRDRFLAMTMRARMAGK
jgi:predicted Zn-dependent protease